MAKKLSEKRFENVSGGKRRPSRRSPSRSTARRRPARRPSRARGRR